MLGESELVCQIEHFWNGSPAFGPESLAGIGLVEWFLRRVRAGNGRKATEKYDDKKT